MGCCGGKRAEAAPRSVRASRQPTRAAGARSSRSPIVDPLTFELVGAASLTVVGPISGRRYRFSHPGALVVVDPRDSRALSAVSALRRAGA
jgi:hypothetical protein